jgi:hypothetical protein
MMPSRTILSTSRRKETGEEEASSKTDKSQENNIDDTNRNE